MRRVAQEDADPGELVAVGEADLARLRDRLAEIEAEHAMLEAELAVFEADYTRQVVTVLAQLHDVEAKILARSGDAAAAGEARARARRTTSAAHAIAPDPEPVPPASLKRAFRDAAKRMHPDLAPSDDARGHAEAFMKRLNQAYRAGDAEAIQDLATTHLERAGVVSPWCPWRSTGRDTTRSVRSSRSGSTAGGPGAGGPRGRGGLRVRPHGRAPRSGRPGSCSPGT